MCNSTPVYVGLWGWATLVVFMSDLIPLSSTQKVVVKSQIFFICTKRDTAGWALNSTCRSAPTRCVLFLLLGPLKTCLQVLISPYSKCAKREASAYVVTQNLQNFSIYSQ